MYYRAGQGRAQGEQGRAAREDEAEGRGQRVEGWEREGQGSAGQGRAALSRDQYLSGTVPVPGEPFQVLAAVLLEPKPQLTKQLKQWM